MIPPDTGSVSIYTSDPCQGILESFRNRLLNFFEVKFGIPEERFAVDGIVPMREHLISQAKENKMVLLCEDPKTIAIEFKCHSLKKTSVTEAPRLWWPIQIGS